MREYLVQIDLEITILDYLCDLDQTIVIVLGYKI